MGRERGGKVGFCEEREMEKARGIEEERRHGPDSQRAQPSRKQWLVARLVIVRILNVVDFRWPDDADASKGGSEMEATRSLFYRSVGYPSY